MKSKLPFFALALVGLLSGIWAGLIRIGFNLPAVDLATLHGPLMVGGFVGTLIGVERSLLAGNGKWWLIPALSGAAVIAWLLGFQQVAPYCLVAASALLVLLQAIHLLSSRLTWVSIVQLCGALCFAAGNIRLLFNPLMPAIIPFWMGFVLCFILATRLSENSAKNMFMGSVIKLGLILFIVSLMIPFHLGGYYLTGAGLILIASGMFYIEIQTDQGMAWSYKKYSFIAIMLGWFWLLTSGLGVMLWKEHIYGYDATTHSFFVGFLFSMVFIHALAKASYLAGLGTPPFHPVLFVWLILLSGSLLLRVFATDILLLTTVKKWSGLLNAISILGFLLTLISLTLIRKYRSAHEPI
ncbi:MAG: hypothetical protein ACMVP2_09850 [Imperialibacter sp.]|uniref:hypothetical protein n=1 Tax=Imperialibacter sp. TaxID=2038411 RepID=UPI003A899417